ncbi:MAG: transposase [Deltaproteobacteria bacterium]|nr:transposase [Deltaproteobacteria bacterium]
MSRRKQSNRVHKQRRREIQRRKNKTIFKSLVDWLIPEDVLFTKDRFHGNIKWTPEQLAQQAIIWAWQDTRNITDAFAMTLEACEDLKIENAAKTYTAFINALDRYRETFGLRLGRQFQALAEEVAGRFWRDRDWVLMGFDGSRVTIPRTVSNEKEFCAPNYGKGKTAKYRKKKTKGMRRRKNKKNKPQPQAPQTWITMMWHMSLRLPWSWRLGPSNSSERGHVMEILEQERFPEDTLFCGDAGFVGYEFWKAILAAGGNFLVRVGGNVNLLSETADIKRLGGGIVLCWPKGKMDSGAEPLRLRLVKVKIGKTTMWMLTSVLDRKKLPNKKIIKYYKMRWGVEVEFRGLKQTIDKRNLRCRNSNRVYVELDWSIRAMAFAELIALREQIPNDNASQSQSEKHYDTKDRSLANTVRALRKCMRNLNEYADPSGNLLCQLSGALVQKYNNYTDKKARYRPKNPDKKPLGEPKVRKLNRDEREKLRKLDARIAA